MRDWVREKERQRSPYITAYVYIHCNIWPGGILSARHVQRSIICSWQKQFLFSLDLVRINLMDETCQSKGSYRPVSDVTDHVTVAINNNSSNNGMELQASSDKDKLLLTAKLTFCLACWSQTATQTTTPRRHLLHPNTDSTQTALPDKHVFHVQSSVLNS